MNSDELLILLSLSNLCILGVIAIVRTYLTWKTLKLQKQMLEESRAYWHSWKERRRDVARVVIEEMSTEELQKELERRGVYVKKRKTKKKKTNPSKV